MIDERTEELAAAHVLGALDEEEMRLFERRLQSDAELRALVSELRGVTQLLAGTSAALQPSTGHRARLVMELGEPRAPRSMRVPGLRVALPWALAAGLAALCLIFAWQVQGLRLELDASQHRLDALNRVADALRMESADLRQSVLTLQQSNQLANMRIAVMNSLLRSEPEAVAVSVWDNAHQSGVVVVRHLRPPPKDKDYQLWIIDPRYPAPVDAGLLSVDASGNGRVEFRAKQPIQSANQFAVTEEVKGGSPVATVSATVLAGA
ncbi:MAG: anti-sigma factor [Steroidobacteraceae bacterium]